MAAGRDEIREHLVAVIEAAPELPRGDREHLADVFLDQLNTQYDLVPRGSGNRPRRDRPAGRGPWRRRWVPIVLALVFLFFLIPAIVHHFPIFLLAAIIVFLAVRKARSRRSSTAASY